MNHTSQPLAEACTRPGGGLFFSYQHVIIRVCDTVAHKLARFAYDYVSSFVWDGDPPSFIVPDVMNNVYVFG